MSCRNGDTETALIHFPMFRGEKELLTVNLMLVAVFKKCS